MGGQIIDNSRREYEAGTNIGTGLAQGIQYREQFRYQAAKDALAEMWKGISMSDIPEVAYRENIGQMGALLNEMQSVGGGSYFQSDPALKDPKTQSALAGIEQFYRQYGYGAKTLAGVDTHVLNLGEYPPFSQEELKKEADKAVDNSGGQAKETKIVGTPAGFDWLKNLRVDYPAKFGAQWVKSKDLWELGAGSTEGSDFLGMASGSGEAWGVPNEQIIPTNTDELLSSYKNKLAALTGKDPKALEKEAENTFWIHMGQWAESDGKGGQSVVRRKGYNKAIKIEERDEIMANLQKYKNDPQSLKYLVDKYGADKIAFTQMYMDTAAKGVGPNATKASGGIDLQAAVNFEKNRLMRDFVEKGRGQEILTEKEKTDLSTELSRSGVVGAPTDVKASIQRGAYEKAAQRRAEEKIEQLIAEKKSSIPMNPPIGAPIMPPNQTPPETPAATNPEAPALRWSQMQAGVQQRAAANVGGNAPALDPNTTLGQMASKSKNIEQMFASKTPGIQMMDRLEALSNTTSDPQRKAQIDAKYEQVYAATLASDGKTAKQLSDMLAHDPNYRKAQMVKDKVLQEATTGDLRINSEEARLYRYACTKEQDATVWQMRMMQNKETRDAIMREVNDRLSNMSPELLAIGFGSDVANVRLNELQINAQIEAAEQKEGTIDTDFALKLWQEIGRQMDSTSMFGQLKKSYDEQYAKVAAKYPNNPDKVGEQMAQWMSANNFINNYNEAIRIPNVLGYLGGTGNLFEPVTEASMKYLKEGKVLFVFSTGYKQKETRAAGGYGPQTVPVGDQTGQSGNKPVSDAAVSSIIGKK